MYSSTLLRFRALNERLSNSLFLRGVDADEVKAAMTNVEYEQYKEEEAQRQQQQYEQQLQQQEELLRQQMSTLALLKGRRIPPGLAAAAAASQLQQEEQTKQHQHGRGYHHIHDQHHQHHHHEKDLIHPKQHHFHGNISKMQHMQDNHKNHSLHFSSDYPFVENIEGKPIFITKLENDRYFGDQAKVLFYEQYRKLSYQLHNIAPHGKNSLYIRQKLQEELEKAQAEAEAEDDGGSTIATNPSLLRSMSGTGGGPSDASVVTFNEGGEGEGDATAGGAALFAQWDEIGSQFSVKEYFSGKDDASDYIPKRVMRQLHAEESSWKSKSNSSFFAPVRGESEAVSSNASAYISKGLTPAKNELTESFFSDLQAFTSNEKLKRRVDRTILMTDSHKELNTSKTGKLSSATPPRPRRPVNDDASSKSTKSKKSSEKMKALRIKISSKYGKKKHANVVLEPIAIPSSSSSVVKKNNQQQLSWGKNSENEFNEEKDDEESVTTSIVTGDKESGIATIEDDPDEAMERELYALGSVSPRTKYLSACIREGVKPLPHIIIRSKNLSTLNLSHYSMGDEMGKILAECIHELPFIDSINLNDNNLTDESLQYLIESIIAVKTLKELDLSRNKIDGYSSEALAEYVSRPDCPIVKLTLQHADVDDDECNDFVQKLVSNKQLLELDLSSNLLGSAEMLSQNDSNVTTGGAAIAEFIKSSSCRLQVLKLAWNAIRLNSAVTLMQALAYNNTITYLDLNNNGLGYAAGEVLGDAILENRTLQTLLVNNNNLTSTAVCSICSGVVENLALKHLEMNENPIGGIGAKIVMQVSIALGSRIKLDAKNCNTITTDERCWYDPTQPCRDYELHLYRPFDRAVAFNLLNLVASHSTLIFSNIQYEEIPNSGKLDKIRLIQSTAKDRELYFDDEQKKILAGYRLVQAAASNHVLGTKLFYEADADGSGKLDKDELMEVLHKIGFIIEEDRLADIMALFDVDGAGTIDLQEFLCLLKVQQREATLRIKEMIEYPILCLPNQLHKKYIPPRKGIIYCKVIDGFVQKSNFYTISSIDQKYAYQMAKGIGDVTLMTEAVRNSKMRYDEGYTMYKTIYKEQPDRAAVLLKVLPLMMNPVENRQLVSKATNDDFIEMARIKLAFGIALRPMFGSYNGYYCLDLSKEVHRVCLARLLEQSQTWNSRRMARSIIAPGKVGDVSQHGNWTCFRNEVFNGKKIVLTPQMFTPMLTSGTIEFDFSGGDRPNGSEMRITDKKLLKVLMNICLLPTSTSSTSLYQDCLQKLSNWKTRAKEKNRDGNLFMPIYAFQPTKAFEVSIAMDEFYDAIEQRQEMLKNGENKKKKQDDINIVVEGSDAGSVGGDSTATGDSSVTGGEPVQGSDEQSSQQEGGTSESKEGDSSTANGDQPIGSEGESVSQQQSEGADTQPAEVQSSEGREEGSAPTASNEQGTQESQEQKSSGNDDESLSILEDTDGLLDGESMKSNEFMDQYGNLKYGDDDTLPSFQNEEGGGGGGRDDESLDTNDQEDQRKKRILDLKRRLQAMLQSKAGITIHAKAQRFVEVIDETLSQVWLLSRHVALVVLLFENIFGPALARSPTFGSYSAEIVIALFPRIVDLHNFELILEVLNARDCAAVFCRVGLLNIFNPLKPEVTYELDLDRREERVIAKIIVYLSVEEPGINLTFKQFQWKRELDPIPGWDVTEPWMTEDGMSAHGKFAFTYYSGEGKNKYGCVPDLPLRRALCQLVLLDENEIIDEDEVLPDEFVNTAITHSENHRDVWVNYLINNPQEKF